MHTIRNTSLIALSLTAFACSSGPGNDGKVDIGDRDVAVLGEKLSDFSGEWDGYLEAFEVAGSDRIRISLDASGNGTARFGTADEAPPLSSDPLVAYPPGGLPGQVTGLIPVYGYGYSLTDGSLDNRRLRFGFHFEESHDPWCALQTPFQAYADPVLYKCSTLRDDGSGRCSIVDPQSGELLDADCNDEAVYGCQTCNCDSDSCESWVTEPVRFDGTLEEDGARFVGTLVFPSNPYLQSNRATVRLDRVTE